MIVLTKKGTNGVALGRLFTLSTQPGVYDDANVDMESQTFGTDSTAGIQAVLDKASTGPIVVDWDVRCSISSTLRIGANTAIKGRNGCGVIRRNFANCYMFLNKNPRGMRSRANTMVVNSAGELVIQNNDNTTRYMEATDHFVASDGYNNLVLADIVDENISIENLIINGNGFIGSSPKQAHDTADGWTILVRLAGVRNTLLDNIQFRNQSVFCMMVTNFNKFVMPNMDVRCNSTKPVNSDGFKLMVGKGAKIGRIAGTTGDDIFSCCSEDGLFPWYHKSVLGVVQPDVIFRDKYAVFGLTDDVQVDEIFLDGSGFGTRHLTLNSPIKNFRCKWLHGTCDLQPVIIDNFTEGGRIGDNFVDLTGAGINAGGNFENIWYDRLDVQRLTPGYKPAIVYIGGSAGGTFKNIGIGTINRTNFQVNVPSVLVDANTDCESLYVGRSENVKDVATNNAIIEIGGRVRKLVTDYISVDSSKAGLNSNPCIRTVGSGQIDELIYGTLVGNLVNFLIENETNKGTIGRISGDRTIMTGGLGAIYNGNPINIIGANLHNPNNANILYLYNANISVTTKNGAVFGVNTTTSSNSNNTPANQYQTTANFIPHDSSAMSDNGEPVLTYGVATGSPWKVKADPRYINGTGHQLDAGTDGYVKIRLTNCKGFDLVGPTDLTTKGNVHIYLGTDGATNVELDKTGASHTANDGSILTSNYPTQKVTNPNGSAYAWAWFSYRTPNNVAHTLEIYLRQDGSDPSAYMSFEGVTTIV